MAIYSTFFLASPDALAPAFPGWKPPLPVPVQRTVKNPFTGQERIVTSAEPDWAASGSDAIRAPRVVPIEGDYATYLEQRLPVFVQQRPHWATKSLTDVEVGPLLEAAQLPSRLDIPRYAPPSGSAQLRLLPIGCGTWSDADAAGIARRWAEMMSKPEHTHSVSGKRVKPDMPEDEARWVVDELAKLAARADPGDRVLLLMEW